MTFRSFPDVTGDSSGMDHGEVLAGMSSPGGETGKLQAIDQSYGAGSLPRGSLGAI